MREAGILRALGATQGQLSRAQAVELACVGILAGLLASLGAALTGWLLATRVFDFAWSWSSPIWIAGPVAGVVCAYAAGWIALRSILRQPPMLVLRQA
jgi:putative ABC transport system permease protein